MRSRLTVCSASPLDGTRMTQEQVAERCDLNTRTVQKIEAGTLRILLPTADRLRLALGVSWNRLME